MKRFRRGSLLVVIMVLVLSANGTVSGMTGTGIANRAFAEPGSAHPSSPMSPAKRGEQSEDQNVTAHVVSLANADLTFWGEDPGDWSGYSVAPAGDVNHDGYDDMIIGAPYAGVGGPKGEGRAYLILGRPWDEWPADHIDLSDTDIKFIGQKQRSMTGRQNYTAGDVNGDGYDDFLITCWKCRQYKGVIYLYLGTQPVPWGPNHPVQDAHATFYGELEGDRAGYYVSTAGDVNDDGYDDFVISALANSEAGFRAGQVYLFLGKPEANWGRGLPLDRADASFWGEAEEDAVGRSVAAAGDVNGDGYDDFLIGSMANDEAGVDAGQAYLILGREAADWGMDYPLSLADASFLGEVAGDEVGRRVAGGGDVNGDGFDDLLFGASYNDQAAPDAGKAFLVLGREAADWGMDYSLAMSDASFLGESVLDQAGRRVSGAGDINDDGYADFLIGAPHSSRAAEEGGAAYLLLGRPDADWGQDYSLSGADVIYVAEAAFDHAGFDIAPAGDMNGDGIDDLLIGAWNASEHGGQCGQSYVVLGGQPWGPAPLTFAPDSPEGQVGEWHSFRTDYGDLDGWADIAMAQMVIGRATDDRIALNVKYETNDDALYLWDGFGMSWLGPCSPGEAGKLNSGVVQLDCRRTRVINDGGDQLRVVWRGRWIRPLDNPLNLNVYLRAVDQDDNDSGFSNFGAWTLLPAAD